MLMQSIPSAMKPYLAKLEKLCFQLLDHSSPGIRERSIKIIAALPVSEVESQWVKLVNISLDNLEYLVNNSLLGVDYTAARSKMPDNFQALFPMPEERKGAGVIYERRIGTLVSCLKALLVSFSVPFADFESMALIVQLFPYLLHVLSNLFYAFLP